jgi:phosphatidylglycerophosphate synthase
MPDSGENKHDCYSAGERAWMEYGQRLRAVWLKRGLASLTQLGVTADMVTWFAGAIGLGFTPLWLMHDKGLALMLLLAHVLLDGLDGPLARFQKRDSPRGSFTDTFSDQLVVTAVTIAWMIDAPSGSSIATGTIYVFVYAMVVAMAMARNALAIPYSWLFRPRFLIYVTIAIDYVWQSNLATLAFWLCNVLLAIKMLSGFLALRRELPGPTNADA